MTGIDTFVITYDPLERQVHFAVHKSTGVIADIADGEPLKDYENTNGLFTLEGQHNEIFKYIKENFDGKSIVSLRVEVPQLGIVKSKVELERFCDYVMKFNKTNEIRLELAFVPKGPAPKQAEKSSVNESIDIETVAQKNDADDVTSVTSAASKPKLKVKVAVVGKVGSGKTELIKGLTIHKNSNFEASNLPSGTIKYTDSNNNIEWYEIAGIEFGKENIEKAREQLERLIDTEGVSIVLYCFNAKTGKIENAERNFIVDVKRKYSNISLFAVITASIDEEASCDFADKVSISTKQTKTFNVLATEMRTKTGFLQPFGLEEMTKNIYGGR